MFDLLSLYPFLWRLERGNGTAHDLFLTIANRTRLLYRVRKDGTLKPGGVQQGSIFASTY